MTGSDTSCAACAHCGLPVRGVRAEQEAFCCYGCYLVRRLVGKQGTDSPLAWNLLRLGVGTFLSMNVMMISLLIYTSQIEQEVEAILPWLMLALATPAMAILVYPFIQGCAHEIRSRRLSLDTLVAIGSVAAYGTSALNTVRLSGEVYYDTATMLLVLVTLGRLIEASAKGRTRQYLDALDSLLPVKARRLSEGQEVEVAPATLEVGDRVLVLPGERIPADGQIVDGHTVIEEAAFTGEPAPRSCGPGARIFAGTLNGQSAVVAEVLQTGEGLLLRRIMEAMEQARERSSPSERLSQRLASVFVPAVLTIAVGAGAYHLYFAGPAEAAMVVLAVLVVACPCAMGIAAPLATALAVARAARVGMIVRGGEALERLGQVRQVLFDKTGTLSEGKFRVRGIDVDDSVVSPAQLLAAAAALESRSEHSLARAVVDEARRQGLPVCAPVEIVSHAGLGLEGVLDDGRRIVAGSQRFVSSRLPSLDLAGGCHCEGPDLTIHVGWDGTVRGRVVLEDTLRPQAGAVCRQLREMGIEIAMISGDTAQAAWRAAAELGILRVHAPCLPHDKGQIVRDVGLRCEVAFVGDGLNDGPALAAATVGIAIGAGTELAKQAGNVVLLQDRLEQIPWLIQLGRRTRRIVLQNLLWAAGYNAIAMAAAACGVLQPVLAAAAMAISSITVIGNSMRLTHFADPPEPSSLT